MMTKRLYFDDQYIRTFDAAIVARATRDGLRAVALDRTAFYPEGGGQPADRGTLNGVAVVDVQADGDVIWHVVDGEIAETGVHGEIDWDRRFDHMQQHHGQHLLSAALEHLFGLHTLSFHLGPATATIDLDSRTVSDEQLREAESLVNRVIWEDRPVETRFVSREQLAEIPLRKAPTVEGPIRVVSVPDFDHTACGGTHPRSTGPVGVLHIRKRERRGDATRVEFACGGRVLKDLHLKHDLIHRLGTGLTVGLEEIEGAVDRLRESESRARKELDGAKVRLRALDAAELLAGADRSGAVPVVSRVLDDRPVAEAQALARELTDAGAIAVLGVRGGGGAAAGAAGGAKTHLILARPESARLDCGSTLKEVLTRHGGRGGGRPELAQGGLPDGVEVSGVVAELAGLARQGGNFE